MVLAVLNECGFEEDTSRQNVISREKRFVYSDTMGAVRARSGAVLVTQATVLPGSGSVAVRRVGFDTHGDRDSVSSECVVVDGARGLVWPSKRLSGCPARKFASAVLSARLF